MCAHVQLLSLTFSGLKLSQDDPLRKWANCSYCFPWAAGTKLPLRRNVWLLMLDCKDMEKCLSLPNVFSQGGGCGTPWSEDVHVCGRPHCTLPHEQSTFSHAWKRSPIKLFNNQLMQRLAQNSPSQNPWVRYLCYLPLMVEALTTPPSEPLD